MAITFCFTAYYQHSRKRVNLFAIVNHRHIMSTTDRLQLFYYRPQPRTFIHNFSPFNFFTCVNIMNCCPHYKVYGHKKKFFSTPNVFCFFCFCFVVVFYKQCDFCIKFNWIYRSKSTNKPQISALFIPHDFCTLYPVSGSILWSPTNNTDSPGYFMTLW